MTVFSFEPVRKLHALVAIAACSLLIGQAGAAQAPAGAGADEIVVTAQRSGIPMWTVRNGDSTLVLVGMIDEVAKGTNWNPEALASALRNADQVMYPEDAQITAGFFQILGAPGKVRRMKRLPGRSTLADYLSPLDYRRLSALRDRSLLNRGFETSRPLFVAYDLMESAKGEPRSGGFLSISKVDVKTDPNGFVRKAIADYHLRLAPMRKVSLNDALARIDAQPPSVEVPCLLAAVRYAESPPGTFQARSQAWIQHRIPELLDSAAEKAFLSCAAIVRDRPDDALVLQRLAATLAQHRTTMAVLDIGSLAKADGILDGLAAQGFQISGPRWKH